MTRLTGPPAISVSITRKSPRTRGPITVELESWNGRWVMMGQGIYCVGCHVGQDALYASHVFVHAEGCALVRPTPQYAWHELRALLRHLPKAEI